MHRNLLGTALVGSMHDRATSTEKKASRFILFGSSQPKLALQEIAPPLTTPQCSCSGGLPRFLGIRLDRVCASEAKQLILHSMKKHGFGIGGSDWTKTLPEEVSEVFRWH